MLYLEDLATGQRFISPERPLAPDTEKRFRTGTGQAGELHVASMTMRLIIESDFRLAGGILGAGIADMRWPTPAKPGEMLHVQCEVLEVRRSKSRPDRGLAKIRNVTLNAAHEPVQIMTSTVVVHARKAEVRTS